MTTRRRVVRGWPQKSPLYGAAATAPRPIGACLGTNVRHTRGMLKHRPSGMQRLRRFIIHSKKRALWIGLALVTLLVVWSILLPVAQTGTAPDWTRFRPRHQLAQVSPHQCHRSRSAREVTPNGPA